MAKKYEVISKEDLKNVLINLTSSIYVNLPYNVNQHFSPTQVNMLETMVQSIQHSMTNNIMAAISCIDTLKCETIDRCFLCDKNDAGGPKCPM